MHHFRGKLLDGDRVRLDPADVFIQYNSAPGAPRDHWLGYLRVAAEGAVEAGADYVLRLEDGRSGPLRVERIDPDDSGKFRATFVGRGLLA